MPQKLRYHFCTRQLEIIPNKIRTSANQAISGSVYPARSARCRQCLVCLLAGSLRCAFWLVGPEESSSSAPPSIRRRRKRRHCCWDHQSRRRKIDETFVDLFLGKAEGRSFCGSAGPRGTPQLRLRVPVSSYREWMRVDRVAMARIVGGIGGM
jgi:hypothetical protein